MNHARIASLLRQLADEFDAAPERGTPAAPCGTAARSTAPANGHRPETLDWWLALLGLSDAEPDARGNRFCDCPKCGETLRVAPWRTKGPDAAHLQCRSGCTLGAIRQAAR